MPTTYRERSMNQLMDSIRDVGAAMKANREKKRMDAIARSMSQEMYPEYGIESMDELKMRMEIEDMLAKRNESKARTQSLLREPQPRGGATYIDTPEGPMTPAQWAAVKDRRAAHEWQRRNGRRSADASQKIEQALNSDLLGHGLTADDVPRIRNQRLADSSGDPTEEGTYFLGEIDGRQLRIPRKDYEELRNTYDVLQRTRRQAPQSTAAAIYHSRFDNGAEPNADVYTQQVQPQVTGDAPVKVSTKEQRDRLPPGTRYIAPDGSIKIKR